MMHMGLFHRTRTREVDGVGGCPATEVQADPAPAALEPTPEPDRVSVELDALGPEPVHQTVGDAVAAALEMERDRYEIALIHVENEELVRTGLLVSMRDLEVLGSAAHHYSQLYENPERRYPQVLARRERARRIGRTLWRFAVDRCGIEEADRVPSRVHSA